MYTSEFQNNNINIEHYFKYTSKFEKKYINLENLLLVYF